MKHVKPPIESLDTLPPFLVRRRAELHHAGEQERERDMVRATFALMIGMILILILFAAKVKFL